MLVVLTLLVFLLFPPLVVATDDERIAQCCRGFGADVIMTSVSCQNGNAFIVL